MPRPLGRQYESRAGPVVLVDEAPHAGRIVRRRPPAWERIERVLLIWEVPIRDPRQHHLTEYGHPARMVVKVTYVVLRS